MAGADCIPVKTLSSNSIQLITINIALNYILLLDANSKHASRKSYYNE